MLPNGDNYHYIDHTTRTILKKYIHKRLSGLGSESGIVKIFVYFLITLPLSYSGSHPDSPFRG
jgi:activator of HSP90 ATPase